MGDPKKIRKKYSTPIHPWNAVVIETERVLVKEYGLKNKKELWKGKSILKKYKDLAKKLIAVKTEQGEMERKQMLDKLQKWGLIDAGAELDNVLSLDVKDLLERRLQSLVYRLGLARSMEQARQFIVHRHILVGDKKVTFPSAIVSKKEEGQIKFDGGSSLNDEEHPERVSLKEVPMPVKKAKEEKTEVPKEEKKEAVVEEAAKEKIPSAEELVKETKEKFEKQ